MATLPEARERIYQAFVDAAVLPTGRYTFENEVYTPPVGETWARLVVRHRVRAQETLGIVGNRKFESLGGVIVQCFAPLDTGTAGADTVAQAVRAAFEGKVLLPEHIRLYGAQVREIGSDGAWYQINVEAFFNYDETK